MVRIRTKGLGHFKGTNLQSLNTAFKLGSVDICQNSSSQMGIMNKERIMVKEG